MKASELPAALAAGVRVNVTGQQGNRRFLWVRGIEFAQHNPTVASVRDTAAVLRDHTRHRGHKGCLEAADLLDKILRETEVRCDSA